MEILTAPSKIRYHKQSVFLAGGIMQCPDWQQTVCDELVERDNSIQIVFNPRRENFPMDDPDEGVKQIQWEHKAIKVASIFSMWFCAGESDQPICMYELGSVTARNKMVDCIADIIVVGIEPGYKREFDVKQQLSLVDSSYDDSITNNLYDHINNIIRASNNLT